MEHYTNLCGGPFTFANGFILASQLVVGYPTQILHSGRAFVALKVGKAYEVLSGGTLTRQNVGSAANAVRFTHCK